MHYFCTCKSKHKRLMQQVGCYNRKERAIETTPTPFSPIFARIVREKERCYTRFFRANIHNIILDHYYTFSMNKRIISSFILSMFLSCMAAFAGTKADYNVVPLPRTVSLQKGTPFLLKGGQTIYFTRGNADMERNARFFAQYVKEATGMALSVEPTTKKSEKNALTLVLDKKISGKEAYNIKVSNKGVVVSASTPAGIFYGIQTLRKALPVVKDQTLDEVELPAATIADAPRFAYRGMMLDVARHFFSIDFVKQYIDMLALHNMNTFHWHLTDDQGWRIEIKKYPKLTAIGSQRSGTVMGHNSDVDDEQPYGGYYTQEQCREIVEYARQRYITVIPEIDMPGHMRAALAAYPQLGCTGGPYTVGHHWGIYRDILCAGNEETFKFVDDVLDELMDIFPAKYIHIGGDEAPKDRWAACPKCQQRIKDEGIKAEGKHSAETRLQGYFTKRVEKYLNEHGRQLIGWDEILDGDVNASSTIMSWTGSEPGARAAVLGHDVIMSPTQQCYFDYYQTKNTYNEPNLIGGFVPVEATYNFEPVDKKLTPEQAKHILGVQANLWTEYITCPALVEYQVLPRMGALSEVQWLQPEAKDFNSFKKRVNHLVDFYKLYGWTYAKHLWPEVYEKTNRSAY